MVKKCCGNCDYCAESGEDLVCVNEESEYCGDFVGFKHSCCDWEHSEEEEECE